MKNKIDQIINEKKLDNITLRDFKEIRKELDIMLLDTSFVTINELIYHIYYDFKVEIPYCLICNENKVKFNGFKKLYGKTCSVSCQAKNAARKCSEIIKNLTPQERNLHYKNQQEKRLKTFNTKYGVSNPMQIKTVADKNHKAMRQTNIDSGRWLNFDDINIKDEYTKYIKQVEYITNKQDWKSLTNSDKRGSIKIEGSYHLDHRYSISQGFKDNIPAEIIGSIYNLEMIPSRENSCVKLEKCSITKEDLYELYYENNTHNTK
jgi:hypothetical protein